jgi:hypothetical protein
MQLLNCPITKLPNQSRRFAERLGARKAAYEYRKAPGLGRSFDLWDRQIPAFIAAFVASR